MAIENATFDGGMHIEDYKSLTSDKPVAEISNPTTVTIALNQLRACN